MSHPSLLVQPLPGFSPAIGRLACMLTYARQTTLAAVAGLTQQQLDHLHDRRSNSIGALLSHIAAIEAYYQIAAFEARPPTPAEEERWGAALALGERGRSELRDQPLAYYMTLMEHVRAHTLAQLARRTDDWLEERAAWSTRPMNHHWMWFHVFEDEINHRGQIRWLRARLPQPA